MLSLLYKKKFTRPKSFQCHQKWLFSEKKLQQKWRRFCHFKCPIFTHQKYFKRQNFRPFIQLKYCKQCLENEPFNSVIYVTEFQSFQFTVGIFQISKILDYLASKSVKHTYFFLILLLYLTHFYKQLFFNIPNSYSKIFLLCFFYDLHIILLL